MTRKSKFGCFLMVFFCLSANAQIDTTKNSSTEVVKNIPSDSLKYSYVTEDGVVATRSLRLDKGLDAQLKETVDSLYALGYWGSSLDSLDFEKRSAKIYRGKQYKGFKLKPGNVSEQVFRELRMDRVRVPEDWTRYGEKLSRYLGNLGYPFAQVRLDSITEEEEYICASLNLNQGPQIRYDSIYYEGSLRLRPNYLMRYLNIESRGVYRHDDVVEADKLLRSIPFAKVTDPPQLKFIGEYASLHVGLDQKNASRFDLLVGVNPLNENSETRFFITLDVEAELSNQLQYGEWIKFRYARLRPENQELEFSLRYPYVLDLPIAVTGNFGLYRRSLEFQDVEADAGVDYIFDSDKSVGLVWTYLASRLINVDSLAILNSEKLPSRLDVVRNGLSLRSSWRNLDQRLNPSKGWDMRFKLGASTKNIVPNDAIRELKSETVDFSTAYDTLSLSGFQFNLEASIDRYFPIGQNFALKAYVDGFTLLSNIEIYENEFSRIGGNRLLRGFDEESIFAKAYVIPGLALHVLLDEYSFLSIPFIDYGFVLSTNGVWEQALGIGGGINFRTKAGMLNFSVAAGKYGDAAFDVSRPKVHVGFLSLF